MSNPSSPETLVEHLCDSIRQSIRQGRLMPGQRLVVADLAEMFGASAGPVREAIRRLTGEGIVEFTAHKGASVRSFTAHVIREIFQVREAVEGMAARLAAENIHRADYASQVIRVRDRLRDTVAKDHEQFSDARQAFHDVLYEVAGNTILRETAQRLTFPLYRLFFNARTGLERAKESLDEHERVIEALLAGDGAKAERMMRNHLRSGADVICDLLGEIQAEAGARGRQKGGVA